MTTSSVSIIFTTLSANADAAALARTLVEEHLAACVNILPKVTSIYRWKGTIETDNEQQLIIKTASHKVPALESRLHHLHPYEVPEFLVIEATDASAAYFTWVNESVG